MARGRISGKKIHVEGFTPNDPEKEEIYRVVAQGRSTAGGSAGLTVESNMATVLHEKHAEVRFGTPCHCDLEGCVPELCGCVRVHTKNIKKDTLVVVQMPEYINHFTIERLTPTLYYLKYCIYPGYGSTTSPQPFILAGTDIYGNVIPSDEYWVNPVDVGAVYIELREDMAIPASATTCNLTYVCHPDVVVSTITRYDVEGDIRSVEFSSPNNVTISFPQNYSRNTEKRYRIRIIGYDRFGGLVKSNYVEITQGKATKNGQFYISGDDIDYNQTQAIFVIHHDLSMTGINIVDCSSTITEIQSSAVTSPDTITVTALTEVNSETSMKSLTIIASGLTVNGTIAYAEGLIYQMPGVFLLILGKCTGNKTGSLVNETTADIPLGNVEDEQLRKYCSTLLRASKNVHEYGNQEGDDNFPSTEIYPADNSIGYENYTGDSVAYFVQNLSFRYISYGVTGITASGDTAFTSAGGRAVVNTSSKTVALTFSKNTTGNPRTFTITLYGKTSSGMPISATYTFTQMEQDGNSFTLQSGTTLESTAEVPYTTTSITLKVYCPTDYKDIGLATATTTLSSYNIHNARIVKNTDEEYTLIADIYSNTTPSPITYTVIVSGHTGDNRVRYTKTMGPGGTEYDEMTIIHRPYTSTGDTITISPSSASVNGSENSYTVHFTFTSGVSNIWVDTCQVVNGDQCVVSCSDLFMSSGTLVMRFPSNPANGRTIKLRLAGINISDMRVTSNEFTLTQGRAEGANIIIWADSTKQQEVQTLEVPASGGQVYYYVEYVSATSGTPNYSPGIFSGVTNTSAYVIAENMTYDPMRRVIVFYGTSIIDGSEVSKTLVVMQGPRSSEGWQLEIDSTDYYRSEDDSQTFIVTWQGGNYEIKFKRFQDIDPNSLDAVVLDNINATADTPYNIEQWSLDLAEAPRVTPTLTEEVRTRIYVTGKPIGTQTTVSSNTLTFVQPATNVSPDTGDTPTDNAFIQLEPESAASVPGSGGTCTFFILAHNVNLSTIHVVDYDPVFLYFDIDTLHAVEYEPGYWEIPSRTSLTVNPIDYPGHKCFTLEGTSLLDGSTVSGEICLWQLPWRILDFRVYAGTSAIHDGETVDNNRMSMDIESRSPYTIDVTSDNDWIVFMWDGTHQSGVATMNDTYSFDVDFNVGDSPRKCIIYAENTTASQTFTFWQSANNFGLSLSFVEQTPTIAPVSGGEIEVTFSYDGFDYMFGTRYDDNEISSVTLEASGSTGYGTAIVNLKRNDTGGTRRVALTIYGNNSRHAADISGEIYITQAG